LSVKVGVELQINLLIIGKIVLEFDFSTICFYNTALRFLGRIYDIALLKKKRHPFFRSEQVFSPYRAIHKRLLESKGREFVHCGHFADKGRKVLRMRTSALFGAKNFRYFEIYAVSVRTRGGGGRLSQCGHWRRRRGRPLPLGSYSCKFESIQANLKMNTFLFVL